MTIQELRDLSRRVAEKYKPYDNCPSPCDLHGKWLHTDLATVMRLAIEHGVSVLIDIVYKNEVKAMFEKKDESMLMIDVALKDHSTREQAVIVAVLKALCEVEK